MAALESSWTRLASPHTLIVDAVGKLANSAEECSEPRISDI
jgi:hypothetical protein